MNNRLKFRVWDTENLEFSNYTNRDPFFDVSNSKLFFWERTQKEDGSYGGDIILEDLGDRFILQQFTGLYDKRDEEIFEGDVIRGMFNMGPAGEMLHSATVCWDDLNGYQWNYWNLDTVEIIGNISQNPELLKK